MACTCFNYDVIINQIDLDDSTGNTDPGKFDGTVYVDYIDCSGNSQQELYTVANTYLDGLCIDTNGSPVPNIYYYKNKNYLWEIIINNICTVFNVQSSRSNICCNQDSISIISEGFHCVISFSLRFITMDC
jgi:hypothetical protein